MSQHWSNRGHLLGLEDLSRDELLSLLDEAANLLPLARGEVTASTTLVGKTVATLFFENSTRTRLSFTMAGRRLGAEVLDLNASTSSSSKGETLLDTALNVQAMGVDGLVLRCTASGGPQLVARGVRIPVINAGDGRHEHPTQGLLDALALQQHFNQKTFDGLSIAIVGDIGSSRVARSNAHGLTALGANVILTGPPALLPEAMADLVTSNGNPRGSLRLEHELDAVLESVDAIMMLRVQFERHDGEIIADDYAERYGLTVARAARLRDGVPVLHPGPINRGTEIDPEVADGNRSLIMDQVTCGVAVRMAVLQGLLTGAK
ncbi:MAG: aspartate carbamoyltransferase catalytic subunit [Planctomycetota bacterium]|nr:aspartate carbamoyltransferase catalytic subunit [Planctomycetota bacterium]